MWHDGLGDAEEGAGCTGEFVVWIRVGRVFLRVAGRRVSRREREFRSGGLGDERVGLVAAGRDFPAGLVDPVVEWIGFVEAGAVLLQAAAPDVVRRVECQGPAPVADGMREVVGLAVWRVIPFAEGNPELEQPRRGFRTGSGRCLDSSGEILQNEGGRIEMRGIESRKEGGGARGLGGRAGRGGRKFHERVEIVPGRIAVSNDAGLVDKKRDGHDLQPENVVGIEHDRHVLHRFPLEEECHAVAMLLGGDAGDEEFTVFYKVLRLGVPPGHALPAARSP